MAAGSTRQQSYNALTRDYFKIAPPMEVTSSSMLKQCQELLQPYHTPCSSIKSLLVGAPIPAVQSMLQTIHGMNYHIHTAFGDSNKQQVEAHGKYP